MTQARESQAEIDGRKALLLVEFMTRELANDEEGNANDFLDEVIQRLDAAGFLADAQSQRPRTALPASERVAAALGAVRDIAHTLRDPDEEVNSSDFVDGVARRLAAAGFPAESTEPIKRRVYVDGIPQVEDGFFVATSEDEAIAFWQEKSGRFDVARSRLVAKKPCAKCGGPITHPQLAGDEAEVCARCVRSDGSEVTPMSAEPEAAIRRWWLLGVNGDKTSFLRSDGPWDTEAGARAYAAEFRGPLALFQAPEGADAAFEAEAANVRGKPGSIEWYLLKVDRRRIATDIGEGPWLSWQDAHDFAASHRKIGPTVIFLAPPGTRDAFLRARTQNASGRRTTFKALRVGTVFDFASETEMGWQGARGPWVKTSARKYRREGSSMEILVGSIAAPVIEQPRSANGGRYRCWVVAKRRPHSVDEWYVDDRKGAIAEVKRKVREFRTEGGVDSQDPLHPLEVTWSLRRNGTLIETKF